MAICHIVAWLDLFLNAKDALTISSQAPPTDLASNQRVRCYSCYRPLSMCFCDAIPSVNNRTEVLILQHMRERFHPFNTARILRKALTNSTLMVDHNLALADQIDALELPPSAGVLYPGPGGRLLTDLPRDEHPEKLIVIDGTWHHAKTLLRDIPRLNELPRFRIQPAEPGRYRIRREPNATALSTLEATVAALLALEPETDGLQDLTAAFDSMVQTQLDHPKARYGWRQNRRRSDNAMGIPRAILNDLPNVVVAYGESEPGKTGCKRAPRSSDKRQSVYWVAQRLGTGESFRAMIEPRVELPDDYLQHVGLPIDTWQNALTMDEFVDSWNEFLRPTDTLVTYHASTSKLLKNVGALPQRSVYLKSVKFDPSGKHKTLDAFLQSLDLTTTPTQHPGRAGERLANAIALVNYLNQTGHRKRDVL